MARVFGGGGEFGASGGGVFGFDNFAGSLELGGDEAGVLGLLAEYAGGKTLHHSQQWVVRAMRALELRYQASARAEAVQRFNLEVHAHELANELTMHKEALSRSQQGQRQADGDAARALEALAEEKQRSEALRMHVASLQRCARARGRARRPSNADRPPCGRAPRGCRQIAHPHPGSARRRAALRSAHTRVPGADLAPPRREVEQLSSELNRAGGELRAAKREAETLHGRWEQAAHDASEWSARAHEAQADSRHALSEANVARDATNAMQRSLLTAQEYALAEEAGYSMQTIIQLAPSKPIYTTVYNQPQVVDAFIPV